MNLAGGKSTRILIVDDSEGDVYFVLRTLKKSDLSFEHYHANCRDAMIKALN